MSNSYRIGLFTPVWPGTHTANGITTSVYNLAMGLQEIGHQPIIVTTDTDSDPPAGIPCVRVDRTMSLFDKIKGRLGVPDYWLTLPGRQIATTFRQAHQEHALDAIIMEETHGWAGVVQKTVPVPVIVTLHGPWFTLHALQSGGRHTAADTRRERREAGALQRVAGMTAPSRAVLDATLAEIPSLAARPSVIIRNALPVTPRDNTVTNEQNILFVGRFDRLKGADTLLAAFASFAADHDGVGLTFVGPDNGIAQPDGKMLHIADALNKLPSDVAARVTYKGRLDRDSIEALRTTHAVAVMASRYENLNYTMLEAMSAGQAIVSTAVGGPAEVLRDGETALLVPRDDADAMAAAFQRLFDDDDLRHRLASAGSALLAQDFSPAAVAQQTVAFVKQLI